MKQTNKHFLDRTIIMVLGGTLFIVTFILIVFMNGQGMWVSSDNTIPSTERLPAANVPETGDYREVFTVRGRERQAIVHIPPAYDGETPMPIVLILHGYGGDAASMAEITDFSEIADTEGFIAVYPEGIEHSWNSYICCGQAQSGNVEDVVFMVHIIDTLSDRLTIDPQQVYLTGYSNGGMLAYYVAAQFPKRIAAIAPVAASIGGFRTPNAPLIQPSKFTDPVSALIVHGTEDNVVPYEGGESPIEDIAFTSVEESIQFWKDQNNCPDEGNRRVSTEGFVEQRAFFCANGASLSVYLVKQGDHRWFKEREGFNELAQQPSMSELIWQFFEQNPNPNPVEEIEKEVSPGF
jgi:polyhydroxybutyrate depolymerase